MFPIGSIVKKKTGSQKYTVIEQDIPNDKSVCQLYPKINTSKFVFKNSDLELVN